MRYSFQPNRWVFLFALFLGAAPPLMSAACSNDDAGGATMCQPGVDTFCLCRGGAQGTRNCNADGNSFAECIGARGSCTMDSEPAPFGTDPTPLTQPNPDPDGPPVVAANEFLQPCAHDPDCPQGSFCPFGFCTQNCHTERDCPNSHCVAVNGSQPICMPNCTVEHTEEDCGLMYGGISSCSAVDDVTGASVNACGDWNSLPPQGEGGSSSGAGGAGVVPSGHSCGTDEDCEVNQFCDQGHCATGCNDSTDCAWGQHCAEAVCAPGCAANSDCANGQCEGGLCLSSETGGSGAGGTPTVAPAACFSDNDCALGAICENTACVSGCRENVDCPPSAPLCQKGSGQAIGQCVPGAAVN